MRAQDRIKYYYNESSWGIENLVTINFIWYNGDIEKIAEWVVKAWIKVTDSCSWGRPTLVLVH